MLNVSFTTNKAISKQMKVQYIITESHLILLVIEIKQQQKNKTTTKCHIIQDC